MIASLNKHLLALLCTYCVLMSAAYGAEIKESSGGTKTILPHDTAPKLYEIQVKQPGKKTLVVKKDVAEDDTAAESESTIHVSSVDKASIASIGIINDKNGGFDDALWKDSSSDNLESYLDFFHETIRSDTLKTLLIRALTSEATAPQGAHDEWFLQRVQTLMTIGQEEKATQMLAAVPASFQNNSLRKLRLELMLIRGEVNEACSDVIKNNESVTEADVTAGFWQKANILCKVRVGKHDEALIGLDVLREMRPQEDLFFHEAIHKLVDKNMAVKSFPKQWTLLDIALLRLIGEEEKLKDKLDAVPPLALKILAEDKTLEPKLRERVVVAAQNAGIIAAKEPAKSTEQTFSRALGSDIVSLIASLQSGKAPGSKEAMIIAKLAVGDNASNLDNRRTLRLLTLMQPFGYKIPSDVWKKLLAQKYRAEGDAPSAMLTAQLIDAAQVNRKGEAIVLASLLLGDTDITKASEQVLLPIIRGLQLIGMEKEARTLVLAAVKHYK